MRQSIPVDKRIAIALHCLKSGGDFETIGDLYNVGKSTVGVILHEFCSVIVKVLPKKYIFLPTTTTDLNNVVSGFETRWNFKGVVGALDSTHIPIKTPEVMPEDYVNYKGWHSIHALSIVDHAYRFRFVNVGVAGKNADGGVFQSSSLANIGENDELFPKNKDYHFISLSRWLLKPFPESSALPTAQQHFNYRLSRARMVVECAFGRLKSRWRILLKSCDVQLRNVSNIVLACVILHNMCENYKLEIDEKWISKRIELEKRYPQPNVQGRGSKSTKEGETKRLNIMKELFDGMDEFYSHRKNEKTVE